MARMRAASRSASSTLPSRLAVLFSGSGRDMMLSVTRRVRHRPVLTSAQVLRVA